MTVAIPAANAVIISIDYASDGTSWAGLYDNTVLGWMVDETAAIPHEPPAQKKPTDPPSTTGAHAPFPIILGSLPVAAKDTAPIQSPQWALFGTGGTVLVADLWRGSVPEFFDWIATNNGARRQLETHFAASSRLLKEFDAWAARNPDLVVPIGFGF